MEIRNIDLFTNNIKNYEKEDNQNIFPTIQYIQGYIYIENVFVPANFSIQYKKNLFFPNIDGAILNANIQPPLYNNPDENKKYAFENLLEILYYNPIVIATEKMITEEINEYTGKEMIKFIGILDSASIKISYVNASSVINFLAVDLLNYALKISNLYLFGNNLNLGIYNNALISSPSAFLQSIFLKALQNDKISLAFKNLIYPILTYKISPVKINNNISEIESNENNIKNFDKKFTSTINEISKIDSDVLNVQQEKIKFNLNNFKDCDERIFEIDKNNNINTNKWIIESILSCLKIKLEEIGNNQQMCNIINQTIEEAKKETEELEEKFDLKKQILQEQIENILIKLLFEKYNGENGFYVLSDFGKKLLYNPNEASKLLEQIINDILSYKIKRIEYKPISTGNNKYKIYQKNYNAIKNFLENVNLNDEKLINALNNFKNSVFGENANINDVYDLLAKIITKETNDLFSSNRKIKINDIYNTSGVWGISQKKLVELTQDEINYISKIYEDTNPEIKNELINFTKNCKNIDFHLSQSKNMRNYRELSENDMAHISRLKYIENLNKSEDYKNKAKNCLAQELKIAKILYSKDASDYIAPRKYAIYTSLKTLENKHKSLKYYAEKGISSTCAKALSSISPDLIIKNNDKYYFNLNAYNNSDLNTKKKILMLFYNGCHPQAIEVGYPQFNDEIEISKRMHQQENEQIFKLANYVQNEKENISDEELLMLQNISNEEIKNIIREKIKLFIQKVEDRQNNIDYFKDDEIENLSPEIYSNFFEIPFSKMLNLRRFILSSILMPKYFSNWSLLGNAIISNLANLKIDENNLYNLGQLVSVFLNMLNLRLTILTNPIYIFDNEDQNLKNRIIIYALIPDLEIPPIPNVNNQILDIVPINNRISQKNIATNIDINIVSPATTMAILMPIMGFPTLIVFPLEKIHKYSKENTFITATNFVGKWSKLEFIRIPSINFIQSQEENFILNAIKSHQVLPDKNNFSLSQLMFLAYMKYCFYFWRQFAYKELSLSNIPAIYPFFISLPFYSLIPGGGSYIGILETLLKNYSVGGSSYSFGLKNTYNIDAFKNVINVIDAEFKNTDIFRDFRFGVNDYYYLKSIIDLISFNNKNTIYLSLDFLINNSTKIKEWYNIRNFIYEKIQAIYSESIEIALTYFEQTNKSNITQKFDILNYDLIEKIYSNYLNIITAYEYGISNLNEQEYEQLLKEILSKLIMNGKINFYTFKEDVLRKYQ